VTVVAWYAIAVGVAMIGWWAVEVLGGALRRPDRSPGEIGLHVAAEVLTAVGLVAGGVLVLADETASVLLVALGMLLYTVIQSPGYFVARREWAMVVMFAVLAATAVAAIVVAV
jgi:hypothetical protein